jgi:hypothetical protein
MPGADISAVVAAAPASSRRLDRVNEVVSVVILFPPRESHPACDFRRS